jgi:hypothetical protein
MRLIILLIFIININAFSQGYRNCANVSNDYQFLYGITNNLNVLLLKNNLTGNFVPTGKEYQISFVGEFYDPTVIFNFSADLGLKLSNLNLSKLDSVNYKTTTIYLAPYVTYSPCAFNNVIGIRLFPTILDVHLASKNNYGRLGKVSLAWGAGLSLNKSFYRLWERYPYFVPYHAQIFADYSQTYVGNYFNKNFHYSNGIGAVYPYAGIKTTQRNITFGIRILFKFEN